MTKLREDDRLRERFQRLRVDTEGTGRVPEFRSMLARAKDDAEVRRALDVVQGGRSRRRALRVGAWASAALAAAVSALILTDGGASEEQEFARLVAAYASEASAGAWRSPTSRLLEVPGMELVRSIPSIGEPVRGVDPASLPRGPSGPQESL